MAGWLGQLFASGAGEILKPISDIVDNVTSNKLERAEAEVMIKKVVFDYEAKIQELWKEREAAFLNDIANSRAMNMKSMDSTDKFIRRFIYWLAAGVLLATFGLYWFIISGTYPIENKDIVYALTGSLTTISMMVLGFFFGTTMSSSSKNETIKSLVK